MQHSTMKFSHLTFKINAGFSSRAAVYLFVFIYLTMFGLKRKNMKKIAVRMGSLRENIRTQDL
jgi:hypothetical protein